MLAPSRGFCCQNLPILSRRVEGFNPAVQTITKKVDRIILYCERDRLESLPGSHRFGRGSEFANPLVVSFSYDSCKSLTNPLIKLQHFIGLLDLREMARFWNSLKTSAGVRVSKATAVFFIDYTIAFPPDDQSRTGGACQASPQGRIIHQGTSRINPQRPLVLSPDFYCVRAGRRYCKLRGIVKGKF